MGLERRIGLVVALVASTVGAPAMADEPEPAEASSIYDVSLPRDGAVIATSAAGILIPYALSAQLIRPTCPCSSTAVNWFDRGVIGNHSDAADVVSNVTVGLAIAGPPLLDWLALGASRPLLDDVVVFTESLTVNGAINTLVKYSVQRPIPRAYSDPTVANDRASYRSFYSGHTSLVFAALSTTSVTLNERYGLTWQPWLVTGLVGASVAAERVLAGYHFYTDVLVGAAAGVTIGTLIPVMHLRARVQVSPFRPEGGEGVGLAIGGRL